MVREIRKICIEHKRFGQRGEQHKAGDEGRVAREGDGEGRTRVLVDDSGGFDSCRRSVSRGRLGR